MDRRETQNSWIGKKKKKKKIFASSIIIDDEVQCISLTQHKAAEKLILNECRQKAIDKKAEAIVSITIK